MSRKQINIGLFGFGCVGYGLYQVLEKTPGLKASLKKVCIRDPHKPRAADAALFTTNRDDILHDPDINVVVELIDDAEAAFYIVSAALKSGKAVVSANKKMIAEHFEELLALQKQYNVPLLYEAACCASIPIIRNLEEYYDNDLLESIEGIINGSTNYILTQTDQKGLSYEDALAQAQALGYAESNPILDTGGFDAKYKLQILIAHAFGLVVGTDDILNFGIDRLGAAELRYAREKNLKVKLVAQAFKTESGEVAAFVMPKFISPEHKLSQVDDVYNGVVTETCFADTQFFLGKGAGAHPTASAVLSDISALSYDYRYEYKKIHQEAVPVLTENVYLRVLCRHPKALSDRYSEWFETIEESYHNQSISYVIGHISLHNLRKHIQLQDEDVSFVLFNVVEKLHSVESIHAGPYKNVLAI